MGLTTINPTSNTTPDSGQPGTGAVTSPSNTGHAATALTAADGEQFTDSCRWSGFSNVGGQRSSVTLKFDWTEDGSLSGAGSKSNLFRVQYSTDGGSNWTNAINHVAIVAPAGPTTASVPLSAGQDTSLVQVRDTLSVNTSVPGTNAAVTGTVANIKIEAVTLDTPVIILM